MARKKKNQLVDTITHSSGTRVELFIRPDTLTFVADVKDGVSMTGATAAEVRTAVIDYLNKNSRFEWIPVIHIEEKEPFASDGSFFIGIEIDRFYIAQDTSGQIHHLRWDEFNSPHIRRGSIDWDRIQMSRKYYGVKTLALPAHDNDGHRDGKNHYIAYNESSWVALSRIQQAIGELKSKLRETLQTEQGLRRLIEFGERVTRLLGQ